MTHEEAATRLESSLPRMREIIETAKDLHMTWDEVSKDIEVTELAASALRSVAAASADANKRLQEWGWSVYGARWYSMGIEKVHELRTAYLAGHAARQGELDALTRVIAHYTALDAATGEDARKHVDRLNLEAKELRHDGWIDSAESMEAGAAAILALCKKGEQE